MAVQLIILEGLPSMNELAFILYKRGFTREFPLYLLPMVITINREKVHR